MHPALQGGVRARSFTNPMKSPQSRPFVDELRADTGAMDKTVVSLAAHRAMTQPLPRKGVHLMVVGKSGHLSMALAPQWRLARARPSAKPVQPS